MKTQRRRIDCVWYLSVMMLLIGTATVFADETSLPRISTNSEGHGIKRGSVGDGLVSHEQRQVLKISGSRSKSTRAAGQQQVNGGESGAGAQTPNVEFWIYDADVELFSDYDHDGYYSGIDLMFDADTIYSVADVYAVIYLSYDFGPWNEYAATEDFAIYGATGDDEYVVETELVSGYLTGDYDILIELFDAYDGTFVASLGPDESSQLSYLPLEDMGRDTPPTTVIIIDEGGGGSLGLPGLLGLLAVLVIVRRRAIV